MTKDDKLPGLVVWCSTCKKPKAVTRTMGELHLLDCGHHEERKKA
ncbi:hypothetical protein SAMN04488581_5028 [Mycolicibacterium neoaurum]|nr:hypothetical protein [Mycolicibacterium neoaurum]SDE92469.1 hypothetical protein SAMN04488581_5028 [Mycolicibacterium neoaurum]